MARKLGSTLDLSYPYSTKRAALKVEASLSLSTAGLALG